MSLKSREKDRLQGTGRKVSAKQRAGRYFLVLFGISLCALVLHSRSSKQTLFSDSSELPSNFPTVAQLARMNSNQLAEIDIATRNWICGQNLRGSENMPHTQLLDRLQEIGERIRIETNRNFYKFHASPSEYHSSEAYFRMLLMVGVVQQDYGILYNPERVTPIGLIEPNDRFFANSKDVFVHGLLDVDKNGGTCASLPVLYVALGRMLGYPLSLSSAQNHLFVRWEDNNEKWNMEVTSLGLNVYPDDHYRKWPYPITTEAEKSNRYLQTMDAAHETAVFFVLRGACLMADKRSNEAIHSYECAVKLAPDVFHIKAILDHARLEAESVTDGFPPGMPPHPMFQKEPRQIAWMMWKQRERDRLASLNPQPGSPYYKYPNANMTSPLPDVHRLPIHSQAIHPMQPSHLPQFKPVTDIPR